ncbi:phosphotransferase family protein [Nocardioides sp.]|uniref:phosphotransferase family protein n=1 Tax=Nocardioides sp. TaxID=35761 RepID=UPI002733CE86|nr:phosphotransferase family protein [Nocardioides sp.]MDP3894796.1 phosphotransferase family protein [Nocardioides sp.]
MDHPDVTVETKLTTHQRDLADLAERLGPWLSEHLASGSPVRLHDVHAPTGGGLSSVTILMRATWGSPGEGEQSRDLVVRMAPEETSFPVFPVYDLRRQYDVMATVATTSDVPVPGLVGLDESGDVLGAPFIVMAAVTGRTPVDNPPYVFGGWLLEAPPEERRAIWEGTVDVVARLHTIDPGHFPALLAEAGDNPLRSHVEGQRAFYRWALADDGFRIPLLERAFDWLEENWPADPGAPVLCWGDARPGNILFDGVEPAAVLDWEMVSVAPRGVDLAWMPVIHQFFQDIAEVFELPGLPDFAPPGEVAAAYSERTGVEIADLRWYLVYAALRHGIVMARIKRRMIHFGEETTPADPDDYVMHRALVERLLAGGGTAVRQP